jgi:RNA polymerase sigma-70 factor (ECF subfamily)
VNAVEERPVERNLAFDRFYEAERSGLLRTVAFTLDDRDLAAEVTDEALARAFEKWTEVGSMANPVGWTYRVAVNLARNRQRRRLLERRRPVPIDVGPTGIETFADPALARALARLPLDQRAVVVLRFHLDWSVEQVATALDIAPGTVKSRLHRALRRLEHLLEERP